MAYTCRASLFLGLLFALAVLATSLEDTARDAQDSAELNKAHVVKHYFGRNHHRCRKYGVSCKEPQENDASEEADNKQAVDASEEVENKQGVDAEENAMEDKKAHVVKHYFGRNHHRCRKYGVSCKEPQGNDASEELENKQGEDASEEVDNKQGVGAEEKPVEDEKIHAVKHYFGRNHHRCRKYGVSCKEPQGNDASEELENKQGEDASEEVDNKQGVDAGEKPVEDEKIHAVKHYFGRNHHRCRKYGVSCKHETSAQGKEDNEVAEKRVVDTEYQKGVSNGENN